MKEPENNIFAEEFNKNEAEGWNDIDDSQPKEVEEKAVEGK